MILQIFYFILALIFIIYLFGIWTGSLRIKAKRICKIYKTIKQDQPFKILSFDDELQAQKNTTIIYLRTMSFEDYKIEEVLNSIFLENKDVNYEITSLIIEILNYEHILLYRDKLNLKDLLENHINLYKKKYKIEKIVNSVMSQ